MHIAYRYYIGRNHLPEGDYILRWIYVPIFLVFFCLPSAWANSPIDDIPKDTPQKLLLNDMDSTGIESDTTSMEDEATSDSSQAVDDDVWRQLRQAQEYFAQGVAANQEASWSEAQFYLERALKVLADLDIDTSNDTPEGKKYNSLLTEVVADYRLTLLSLGTLPEDASPSAFLEKFSTISEYNDLGEGQMIQTPTEDTATVYDVPVVLNDKVKKSIIYFQTVAREAFERFLTRSGKYIPLMVDILKQYGLPADIVYLPLIESGFNCKAYSWAKAVGPWQFIGSTGKLYNLKRDWWSDERRDYVKSTHAAARFLRDLYRQFGSWELALAAYNGGPARVENAVKRQQTTDFWELDLRKQTEDYVPFFMAATIIAKNPTRYGFHIDYDDPLVWDEVVIHSCMELKTIAQLTGTSVDDIRELNPELLRNVTPPKAREYKLRVPRGTGDVLYAALPKAKIAKPTNPGMMQHKVKPGESLASIANDYGVSQYAIMQTNNFSKHTRFYPGKDIIIPVPTDSKATDDQEPTIRQPLSANTHVVKQGDNLSTIAQAYNTTPEALRRLNLMDKSGRLYVGQVIKLPSSGVSRQASIATETVDREPAGETNTYVVKKGDTMWDIAQKFATTTAALRKLNGLNRNSQILVGQKLLVTGTEKGGGGDEFHIYVVRQGDNLDKIARAFGTSVKTLMQLNNIEDATRVKVGMKLKINLQ